MKTDTGNGINDAIDNYIYQKHYRLVNSVLFYKDGELLAERYYNKFTKESRNNIKSVWKSIISICVGIEFTTECEIEYIIIINVIYALTVIKIQKIELLVIT